MTSKTNDKNTNHGVPADNLYINLKPINDLAQNFDIDLSSCLEEYLQELVHAGHTSLQYLNHPQHKDNIFLKNGVAKNDWKNSENANGTLNNTNFAHAALLLQNSSNVYSRKVEYLYSLVSEALNNVFASSQEIIGNKNVSNKRKSKNSGIDSDIEYFQNFDPNMMFLPLDDVIPIDEKGNKINLPEPDNIEDPCVNDSLFCNENNNNQMDQTRYSLGGSLDQTTAFFQDMNNNQNRKRKRGDWSASSLEARRLLTSLFNEGTKTIDGGNFRLLNGYCDINSVGALLLPGSSLLEIDDKENNVSSTFIDIKINTDVDNSIELNSITDVNENSHQRNDESMEFPQHHDEEIDDFVDGPGFDISGGSPLLNKSHNYEAEKTKEAPCDEVLKPKLPIKTSVKKKNDPWELLDPHSTGETKQRPLRIGNTCLLPHNVEGPPSDLVTGSRTKERAHKIRPPKQERISSEEDVVCIGSKTFQEALTKAKEIKKRRKSRMSIESNTDDNEISILEKEISFTNKSDIKPYKSFTNLAFGGEFKYVAKAETKRKAAEKRKQRQLLMKQQAMSSSAVIAQEKFNNIYEDFEEENEGEGIYLNFDDGGDGHIDCLNPDDDSSKRSETGNVGLHSLHEAFQGNNTHYDDGDEHIEETFEDLCRAHLRAFAKGAEKYAVQTQLTVRVDDWQRRLKPILDDEENRREFDIHEYGSKIIRKVETEVENKSMDRKLSVSQEKHENSQGQSKTVHFNTITQNCDQYEVCRIFLSSLMLCTTENLELTQKVDSNNSPMLDNLQIKLLNTEITNPDENYFALPD